VNADLREPSAPPSGEPPLDATSAPPRLAFLDVYEELFPFVWRIAKRRGVPASALDDVCQDVFVVVHQRLASFEGRSSLRTWVYGILNNVLLMRHRTSARRDPQSAEVDPETLIDSAAGPDQAASSTEAARIAEALLARLTEEKRAMFILVELEGLTVPEAAEAEAVNVNTAYARLRAARTEVAEAVARFRARNASQAANTTRTTNANATNATNATNETNDPRKRAR
jgi:RNA polymerase sigma-70 factor, ECF subfamily